MQKGSHKSNATLTIFLSGGTGQTGDRDLDSDDDLDVSSILHDIFV